MTLDELINRLKKQVDTTTLKTCLNCDDKKTCDECEKTQRKLSNILKS